MAATSRVDGSGVEVILDKLDDPDRPHCPHGPTILFERFCNGRFRRFYACSSCRDRKQCDFYQNAKDNVSEVTAEARKDALRRYKAQSLKYSYSRFEKARQKPEERKFCRKCHILFTDREEHKHEEHPCFEEVKEEHLLKPTLLLTPLDNNKSNAQYLFSEKTIKFITNTIDSLNFTHVLCVGTPTLHENIVGQKTLLLDIDYRLLQFYKPSTFCHYNMFNHHFFGGAEAKSAYDDFILEAAKAKLAVFIDPPFGGLVDLIDHTLSKIESDLKTAQSEGNTSDAQGLTIFWIFPYFLEHRVCQKRNSIHMLDYKVDYVNHESFQEGPKGRKHGSPVRVFTNAVLKTLQLPADEGYRYCDKCEKYVSQENAHCRVCNSCTSKDGTTYVHCDFCEKCVKPSRKHCFKCKRCFPRDHKCGAKIGAGCYICGDLTHKRSDCPQKRAARKGRKITRHDAFSDSPMKKQKIETTTEKHSKVVKQREDTS